MYNRKHDPVLAFDFGGTKLVAAVVDAASGEIHAQVRRPTPVNQGADASLEAILQAGQEISRIGISFGGSVSRDRRRVLRSIALKAWLPAGRSAEMAAVYCPVDSPRVTWVCSCWRPLTYFIVTTSLGLCWNRLLM
jgi:hypothetical protein